jgi:hypothetical protein
MIHFKPVIEMYKASKTGSEFSSNLEGYKRSKNLGSSDWAVTYDKVNIKAVACWETVGAMGVPDNTMSKLLKLNAKWDFLDTQLPLRIEHAFHALGLDEHRASFTPTLWWLDPQKTWNHYPDNKVIKPELVQCWFPGTSPSSHSPAMLTCHRSPQRRRRRQPRP